MKYLSLIIALSLPGIGCSVASQSMTCGDKGSLLKHQHAIDRTEIVLPRYDDAPAYYMLVKNESAFRYAILVKPDNLVAELRRTIAKKNSRMATLLLKEMQKDLPLLGNTDVHKYGINKPFFLGAFDIHMANLIGRGEASIVNLREMEKTRRSIDKIILVKIRSYSGDYRDICNIREESILFVTDVIAD